MARRSLRLMAWLASIRLHGKLGVEITGQMKEVGTKFGLRLDLMQLPD